MNIVGDKAIAAAVSGLTAAIQNYRMYTLCGSVAPAQLDQSPPAVELRRRRGSCMEDFI